MIDKDHFFAFLLKSGVQRFHQSMIGFAARLGAGNARRRPWSALGLAAGAAGAAGGGAFYLWHMLAREKKLCPYCLGTAAASFTMLPLALPELGELFS